MLFYTERKDKHMNYTRKGIAAKQKALNSISGKLGRKLVITILELFLICIVGLAVIGVSAGIGMFKGILASTPQITSNDVAPVGAATFVYDAEGNKIDELVASNSNRIPVTMDKIPEDLAHAFVAIEDERFYEHNGIDYKGIIRAGYEFIASGFDETQGASTITQQLLKNTIFTEWTSEGDNMIKKIKRKVQEQYLAIELTKILDKDTILERYMNTINLGQNTLGVEAAAQRYFGKSVSDLTLSECATIAVITQSPTKYNPILHPENNAERRKTCLDNMLRLGFIDQEEYDEALADDVYSRIESHNLTYLEDSSSSTYFVDAVTYDVKADLLAAGYNETQTEFMLYSGGLRIMTTMDPTIQAIVDEEVANPEIYPEWVRLELDYQLTVTSKDGTQTNYSKQMMTLWFQENVDKDFSLLFSSEEAAYDAIEQYRAAVMQDGDDYDEKVSLTPQPQVSVVVEDQHTGYVVAMAGGRGTKEGRLTLNRATDSARQPGSTFKILAAYAPAFDSAGLTLATVFNDAPFNYDDGTPVNNTSRKYVGLTPLRMAIQNSMNVIAVKTITQITPQLAYDYLLNFGFTTLTSGTVIGDKVYSDINQSTALGGLTTGVTNEELTAAYAAIANGGLYVKPKLYTQVLDADGNVILDNTTPETKQVIKETTAFLLTSAMVDVVNYGTGKRANFSGMAVAGKTGTTSNNKDSWFAGFTPYYTASTWAGYDTPTQMHSKSDANQETNIAKDLWHNVMSRIHEDLPNTQFNMPDGIVQASICSRSGKLAIPGVCDSYVTTEYFAEGTVPTDTCDVHYSGPMCAYDHLPASPECPFQYDGYCELIPIEDESLWEGSKVAVTQPDGSVTYTMPNTTNTCQHDAAFFANPDYEAILNQQQLEMNLAAEAAAAEAEAAAQDPQPNAE